MKEFKIITDSCSDLTTELRSRYDIDYVQMNVVVKGKEIQANLDWANFSPKEIYDVMRGGERITTTQVPTEEYLTVFEKYLAEGKDVLYVACSSALSGSVNTSVVVAKELMQKYPDAKICCVDTLNSCYGEGILAMKAAQMKAEGKSIDEVVAWLEENKLKSNQVAAIENLDYLKRAGRVKASTAFFGNLFGVKPMLISDANGNNYAIKKVKGRKSSMLELVQMCKDSIIDAENQTIYLVHADCEEDAMALKALVEEQIPCKEIYVSYIGPIIGASVGPGTMALYFMGKEVTVVGE